MTDASVRPGAVAVSAVAAGRLACTGYVQPVARVTVAGFWGGAVAMSTPIKTNGLAELLPLLQLKARITHALIPDTFPVQARSRARAYALSVQCAHEAREARADLGRRARGVDALPRAHGLAAAVDVQVARIAAAANADARAARG